MDELDTDEFFRWSGAAVDSVLTHPAHTYLKTPRGPHFVVDLLLPDADTDDSNQSPTLGHGRLWNSSVAAASTASRSFTRPRSQAECTDLRNQLAEEVSHYRVRQTRCAQNYTPARTHTQRERERERESERYQTRTQVTHHYGVRSASAQELHLQTSYPVHSKWIQIARVHPHIHTHTRTCSLSETNTPEHTHTLKRTPKQTHRCRPHSAYLIHVHACMDAYLHKCMYVFTHMCLYGYIHR